MRFLGILYTVGAFLHLLPQFRAQGGQHHPDCVRALRGPADECEATSWCLVKANLVIVNVEEASSLFRRPQGCERGKMQRLRCGTSSSGAQNRDWRGTSAVDHVNDGHAYGGTLASETDRGSGNGVPRPTRMNRSVHVRGVQSILSVAGHTRRGPISQFHSGRLRRPLRPRLAGRTRHQTTWRPAGA